MNMVKMAVARCEETHIGRLDKALDIGLERNWLIVDMEKDWKVIYGFQTQEQASQ